VATCFAVRRTERRLLGVALATACFLSFSALYIAALSLKTGQVTLGESGKLNYARFVNGLPDVHWQGSEGGGLGDPVHPTRLVLESPPVYEFASPVGGTYPPWYDPAYWYQGATPSLDLRRQFLVLGSGLGFYLLLAREQAGMAACVLILLAFGSYPKRYLRKQIATAGMMALAASVFLMYALVYVESRYIASFMVLLWGSVLAAIRLPVNRLSTRLAERAGALLVFFTLINVLALQFQQWNLLRWGERTRTATEDLQSSPLPGEVARELLRIGIRPGESVATIGCGLEASWAYLAGVRIVAEMQSFEAEPFYRGSEAVEAAVRNAFEGTGARAIIAEYVPRHAELDGWYRVGDSSTYIFLFGKSHPPSESRSRNCVAGQ
jgi:hypothetical protein